LLHRLEPNADTTTQRHWIGIEQKAQPLAICIGEVMNIGAVWCIRLILSLNRPVAISRL
jgi:hypothetical protein